MLNMVLEVSNILMLLNLIILFNNDSTITHVSLSKVKIQGQKGYGM